MPILYWVGSFYIMGVLSCRKVLTNRINNDIMGVISVSYPVDKLVIWICEKKADLKRFKNDSSVRLSLLKQVLNTYTKEERQQVVRYMQSHGRIKEHRLIERLQVDLYNVYLNKSITKASEPQQAMVV